MNYKDVKRGLPQRDSRVIAVINQKGGVGKSTTVINLSACLGENKKKVLVVDFDPQGNSTSGYGIEKEELEHDVYDVILHDYPIEDAIMETCQENVFIVPATIQLATAEIELVTAMARESVLKDAIESNENGCYLGECALVGVDSPIHQTGILFYSTLFDENASCHLAFGRAFPNLIKDYDKKTEEEISAIPINESTTHVDFMIGDETLDIDGIDKEGNVVPIFRNGLFVI